MTRRTVLTIVAVTDVIAVVFLRPIADEPAGFFPTTRADVEFRDRGDRFGPP